MKKIILVMFVLLIAGCSSSGDLKRSPCACNGSQSEVTLL